MRRDPDAGIGNHQHDFIAEQAGADHHLAAIGGEFHRVGEQVDDDLLDGAAIGHHGNGPLDIGIDHQALVLGAPGHHAQRFRQRFGQIERLHVELHPAGFDLRHIQDVVDHFEQIVTAG